MIREYAIDPDVVTSSIETLQRVFSDFSADKGRVIGDFPCRWHEVVRKGIHKLGLKPKERKAAIEHLIIMTKVALVKRNGCNENRQDSWLENALLLHDLEAFNAILIGKDTNRNDVFNYTRMINPQPELWNCEQSLEVERQANELANSISTSLHLAKQVMLVDPYFHPVDDNYKQPLLMFIRKIIGGRYNTRNILIHTCEQDKRDNRKTKSDIKRGMIESVQPCLQQGLKIELVIWPSDRLHDRFILTDMVGYSFGHGLSETHYQNAIKVNVNRLGERRRRKLWRELSSGKGSIYETIVVEGS